MHRDDLRALSSFLVYWCVLFCILSYRSVASIKNLDLDGPFSVGDMDWPLWCTL